MEHSGIFRIRKTYEAILYSGYADCDGDQYNEIDILDECKSKWFKLINLSIEEIPWEEPDAQDT